MKILITYASTDRQTRRIARFSAEHFYHEGHHVELTYASGGQQIDLGRFDAVLLAGSLHHGLFEQTLWQLADCQHGALTRVKAGLLTVSYPLAGADPDGLAALDRNVARFAATTGWTPVSVMHVAGAFRFADYRFFRAWALRWLVAHTDDGVAVRKDQTYWGVVRSMLDGWLAEI